MAQDFNWTGSRPQQYNASKTINAILQGMNDRLRIGYDELISKVFNLDTAEGHQLDILAARCGAGRTVYLPDQVESEVFGFDHSDWFGFNSPGGTFSASSGNPGTSLDDNAMRTYIRFKCFANVSSGSLGDMNEALHRLFPGRGTCYAVVENDMELKLVFNFYLTPVEENLIRNRYFPVPAGYSLAVIINP